MKRLIGTAIAVAFLAAGAVLAQTTTHTETTTKRTGAGPNTKVKTETVVGTVKEYEAGKKIKVTGPEDKDYSFDLDEGVTKVVGSIAVGERVKVKYTKDDAGKERVSIISRETGAAMSHEHGTASTSTASAQAAAPAATMHMESTTKSKGPGPNMKVKTETVVGMVKEYEAGKKIKVTGPKDKDYSFDLDENVAMKGAVAAGDRVKVTYTKGDGGDKVTIIAPYPASKKM